ncbi:MAG: amidohydrolase [Alphaproteobacteria bacterium]|nr:MAG: amidohydrolase [Alphaproteobacteria bacterium]
MPGKPLRIVDAHVHVYDADVNRHLFLEEKDDVFEALVGDYSALPKKYPLQSYLNDGKSYQIEGIIWHEYLSNDAIKEAQWAQRLAETSMVPVAIVALVDFLDPRLEERLDIYRSLPNVTAVREHLAWDVVNPRKRFAKRADLLSDPAWRNGVARLRGHDFKCGLEVFAPQLPDLLKVVRLYPDVGFTLAVLGWPIDLSPAGFMRWRKDVAELSRCENVCASISAVECIFGMQWTLEQVSPWIRSLIEMFGPNRCMFGSHMPIAALSVGFERTYTAYQELVADFSESERDRMFRGVAHDWFRVR